MPGIVVAVLLLSALFAAPDVPAAPGGALPPFEATYTVSYGPLRATMQLRLSRSGDGYLYETSLQPRGLASLLRRGVIHEKTFFLVDGDNVRPLEYERTDTIADPARMARYHFEGDHVGGIYKSREIDLPMRDGGQNRISVHVALMQRLRSDRAIGAFPVFDRSRWKDYEFDVLPAREIETRSGSYEAVEVRYSSPGDDKGTSIFFAPALSYLPILIEYVESGDVKSRARLDDYRIQGPVEGETRG
ncbi:MAG: DUF3108 domain-containing protein [Gammaproteobacteria bacterium]